MTTFSLDKFAGKVAVVTGASAGIGKAAAETLVKSGVIVAGLARRLDRLEEQAKKLAGEKGKLHPFQCDLTKEDEILKTFKEITAKLGPIAILLNNAGLAPATNIIDGDSQKWKTILDTNIFAVALCSREAIRSMKENNINGHIINVNSIAGHKVISHPGISLYPASKHAVTAMTESIRMEINREKLPIKVTSISPGFVKTEFAKANFNIPEDMTDKAPGLDAEHVVDAIVYVLSTPDIVNISELTLGHQIEVL